MSEPTENETSSFRDAPGTIVHEEHYEEYSLQIVVAEDEMSAVVSILPHCDKEFEIPPQTLLQELSKAGVEDGIDLPAVEALCRFASKGKEQHHILVAATEPPQPGADAWLEIKIRTGKDHDVHLEENEEGKIDLYTLNLFTSVQPEEEIAILHPAEYGEGSSTVTGKVLAPVQGRELEVRLGGGVRVEDGGSRFIAELCGRVDYSENILSVSEDYIIHGDVDLEVGNINFPGYTRVRGDVLDSFDIRSIKGIEIGGAVGNSYLITDGDITIGSMSGRDEGLIRCGGTLKANYLNGVTVECMGDVIIANEIRNCVIKSAGSIMIKNGVISGGASIALKGIEAKDIGATAGVTTRLTSGIYYPEADRLQMLKAKQKSLAIQHEFINHCLGPLKKKAEKEKNDDSATKRRLTILLERLELVKKMQGDVKKELNEFVFEDHEGNAKINVHRRVKEKVVITLETVTEEVRFEQYGPLSIVADTLNNRLYFGEYSALTVLADEMIIEEPETEQAPLNEEEEV
nr:FapA family protein [uncultured Desulfuromonas sp.]